MKLKAFILASLLVIPSIVLPQTTTPVTFTWEHTSSQSVTGFKLYRRSGQQGTPTLAQTFLGNTTRTGTGTEPTGQVFCYVLTAYLVLSLTSTIESAESNVVCRGSLTAPITFTIR